MQRYKQIFTNLQRGTRIVQQLKTIIMYIIFSKTKTPLKDEIYCCNIMRWNAAAG